MNYKKPVNQRLTSSYEAPYGDSAFQKYAFDRTISRPVRGHADNVGPLWDNTVTTTYGEQLRKAWEGVRSAES